MNAGEVSAHTNFGGAALIGFVKQNFGHQNHPSDRNPFLSLLMGQGNSQSPTNSQRPPNRPRDRPPRPRDTSMEVNVSDVTQLLISFRLICLDRDHCCRNSGRRVGGRGVELGGTTGDCRDVIYWGYDDHYCPAQSSRTGWTVFYLLDFHVLTLGKRENYWARQSHRQMTISTVSASLGRLLRSLWKIL